MSKSPIQKPQFYIWTALPNLQKKVVYVWWKVPTKMCQNLPYFIQKLNVPFLFIHLYEGFGMKWNEK